jgi:hypothetical protein
VTRADWRIVWRITLFAPFLNPIAIFGGLFALFVALTGITAGMLEISAFSILVAVAVTLALGALPALLTGYRLVLRFRSDLEAGRALRTTSILLRGAATGLITSFATSSLALALLLRDDPIRDVLALAASIAFGAGAFSGAAAAWIARRRLRTDVLVSVAAFD